MVKIKYGRLKQTYICFAKLVWLLFQISDTIWIADSSVNIYLILIKQPDTIDVCMFAVSFLVVFFHSSLSLSVYLVLSSLPDLVVIVWLAAHGLTPCLLPFIRWPYCHLHRQGRAALAAGVWYDQSSSCAFYVGCSGRCSWEGSALGSTGGSWSINHWGASPDSPQVSCWWNLWLREKWWPRRARQSYTGTSWFSRTERSCLHRRRVVSLIARWIEQCLRSRSRTKHRRGAARGSQERHSPVYHKWSLPTSHRQ